MNKYKPNIKQELLLDIIFDKQRSFLIHYKADPPPVFLGTQSATHILRYIHPLKKSKTTPSAD